MSEQLTNESVTSGNTYTWPNDDPRFTNKTNIVSKYHNHMISIGGAGTGVITADLGSGYQSVATLATGNHETYLLPNLQGLKVEASGGDITLSIMSLNQG